MRRSSTLPNGAIALDTEDTKDEEGTKKQTDDHSVLSEPGRGKQTRRRSSKVLDAVAKMNQKNPTELSRQLLTRVEQRVF